MAIIRVTSKCIFTGETLLLNSTWFSRGFVSATRPSQNGGDSKISGYNKLQAKIDKETCGKVIEAAETVAHGTKEVVKEVKHVGDAVTKRVANTTGNMVADVAEKGFEKASETADTRKGKEVLDTAKAATEAYKEKKGTNK